MFTDNVQYHLTHFLYAMLWWRIETSLTTLMSVEVICVKANRTTVNSTNYIKHSDYSQRLVSCEWN